MDVPTTWKCRGCGALVDLPAECVSKGLRPGDRRLDQLAQALCGCWVVTLPDSGLAKLLGAIMEGTEVEDRRKKRVVSGRL